MINLIEKTVSDYTIFSEMDGLRQPFFSIRLAIIIGSRYFDFGVINVYSPNSLYKALKTIPQIQNVWFQIERQQGGVTSREEIKKTTAEMARVRKKE